MKIIRLAIYVYEYLMHLGAKNSAQTFLSEVIYLWKKNNFKLIIYFWNDLIKKFGWDKKAVNVGEAPGFLVSWWW